MSQRWTKADVDRLKGSGRLPGATPSKYKAVKVTVDGITFDSKKEAQRYHELKLMQKAGEIGSLTVQPRFPLHAWTDGRILNGGEVIGEYVGDFKYQVTTEHCRVPDRFLEWVVEDVKGMKTLPLARWKQKHLLAEYGITVREIR